MKNARNGGITNQIIMNFLSQQLKLKESKTIAISPENNQFWIILAIIGSSVFSILLIFWANNHHYLLLFVSFYSWFSQKFSWHSF